MPEPLSIITLCVIGAMGLLSLYKTVKEQSQETHATKFSSYTQRRFHPRTTDATHLKIYAYLFALLQEHAQDEMVRKQACVRNPLHLDESDVLLVGDTTRFEWKPPGGSGGKVAGMWLYFHEPTLDITMFCKTSRTRNFYMNRFAECLQDAAGKSHERFVLTDVWVP